MESERRGRVRPLDDSATVCLIGVLREDAAPSAGGGVTLPLAVDGVGRVGPCDAEVDLAAAAVVGGVRLTVTGAMAPERMSEWRAGRRVRTPAQLRRPTRYLNPGVPDQERALARRGVTLVGTVKSATLVEVVGRGTLLSESAASVRSLIRRAHKESIGPWSAVSSGIVTAIVIGDRSGLNEHLQRRLQEAGTYHVIAISGGNIAILAGLTLTTFRFAGLLGRGAMISAIAGLVSYGYIVGGGPSVDRATLMAAIHFGARALDLRGPPLNTLALSAALLVLADPLAVADPGFLLTFGATAAILWSVAALSTRSLPLGLGPAAALGVASLFVEIALFPLAATLFSRITFAGVVLNFAAIPAMAVAQIAGMLVIPTWALSSDASRLVGAVAHVAAAALVRSADLVTYLPFLTWRVASPAGWVIAAYYGCAIAAWWLWQRRLTRYGSSESTVIRLARRGCLAVTVASSVWILFEPWSWLTSRGDGRLHVTFLDVGQGDSAFVVFPGGSTLLVDSGGLPGLSSFDLGDRVVAPVLRVNGTRRLGTLALTHGDADHVGGVVSLIEEFHPWDVWDGVPVPRSDLLQRIRTTARRSGARWTMLQSADEIVIDDVRVVVRHPPRPDWERQQVRNDDSVVLELLWRNVSIVLTGDIERETEMALLDRFQPIPIRIVKVPHHGSLTSSSDRFVRMLMPRAAVVSVGRSNTFGHPARAVLDRYEHAGATVFRTDQDGAVTVDTDGACVEMRGFTGRSKQIDSIERGHHEGSGPELKSPRGYSSPLTACH